MKLPGKWHVEVSMGGENDLLCSYTLDGCEDVELIPASPWVRFSYEGRVYFASGNVGVERRVGAMKLIEAITRSDCQTAERRAKGRPACVIVARAMRMTAPLHHEIRIVASFTDPTVLRKPSDADLASEKWEPVNERTR